MSDKFPWFPFYVRDWQLSRTVRGMTYEQRGIFTELLTLAWHDGTDEPSLPGEPGVLARWTGLGRRWATAGLPVLRAAFTQREDGRWVNAKLSHVWEVQRAKYELTSRAGKLGGIAKAKALAERQQNPSDARRPATQTQIVDSTKSSTGKHASTNGDHAPLSGAVSDALRRVTGARPPRPPRLTLD